MAIERFQYKEKPTSKKLNSFADAVEEACDEVKQVKNDVETYIGSGKETVVVSITSSVEGVSVEDLTLYVYLNNAENPLSFTTDEHGMATFRVDVGYQYRIVFPDIEGCATQHDITHTAGVAWRSIEVEYKPVPKKVELVEIHTRLYTHGVSKPYPNHPVKVKIGSDIATYTTDSNGKVEVEIEVGTTYTVSVDAEEGKYVHGDLSHTYTAEHAVRNIYFGFHDMEVGIFIVDKEGVEYTYDEWIAGGKQPEDTDFVKIATANLLQHNGSFYLKHDHIADNAYATERAWCNQVVQFSNIPSNGNASTALYYYDGMGATEAIIDEAAERGLVVASASFCHGQTAELGNGEELRGFLWSVGQDRQVFNNLTVLNAIHALVRPNATNNYTNFVNTSKWTSAQGGIGNIAYCCSVGVGTDYKNVRNAVVVAYA